MTHYANLSSFLGRVAKLSVQDKARVAECQVDMWAAIDKCGEHGKLAAAIVGTLSIINEEEKRGIIPIHPQ